MASSAHSDKIETIAKELCRIINNDPDCINVSNLLKLSYRSDLHFVITETETCAQLIRIIFRTLHDAGRVVATFFERLQHLDWCGGAKRPIQDEVDQAKIFISLILAKTTLHSPRFCEQLTEFEFPSLLGNEMDRLQPSYQFDREEKTFVLRSIDTISHCSKYPALCPRLKAQVFSSVLGYVDPEVNESIIVLKAMILLNTLDPGNDLHNYYYNRQCFVTLSYIIDTLFLDKMDRTYKCIIASDPYSENAEAAIVLKCLEILAKAHHYHCNILTVLHKNTIQVDQLANSNNEGHMTRALLTQLGLHYDCNNCGGAKWFLNKYYIAKPNPNTETPYVTTKRSGVEPPYPEEPEPDYEEATPTKAHHKNANRHFSTLVRAHTFAVPKIPDTCDYFEASRQYLRHLQVSERYLLSTYNRCFCNNCMWFRNEVKGVTYPRGDPPKPYTLPEGWAKFAIRCPPRATTLNIFSKWHIGYHGTSSVKLIDILETGELLKAGDINPGGETLEPAYGHFTKEHRSAEYVNQFFLSPSILYAGCDVYAPPGQPFDDVVSNKKMCARVVFQVRIKPGSYATGPETILQPSEKHRLIIDPLYHNNQLEWFTKNRGVIILTGILVKLEDPSVRPLPAPPVLAPKAKNVLDNKFDHKNRCHIQ